ncbi:hypothetical protein VMUT_1000 [Vulcanisaeta moutnovskia 768-28]|uniref:Uncharacterized protein n=1 Tax=Vulcanisaeta moutnovskia (strain 768-28) TaxID=985053 RepID=F0QXP4_VULM7|nr:hypothetical protein [Vulcanisaeta moutnovskia]ADY01207.1 hypothetical protein VMUT_1000 [Vulcanisaeta moutnovskia 768-28]
MHYRLVTEVGRVDYELISKAFSELLNMNTVDVKEVIQRVIDEIVKELFGNNLMKKIINIMIFALSIYIPYILILSLPILLISMSYPQLFNYVTAVLAVFIVSAIFSIIMIINEMSKGERLEIEIAGGVAQSMLTNILNRSLMYRGIAERMKIRKKAVYILMIFAILLTPMIIRSGETKQRNHPMIGLVIEYDENSIKSASKRACIDLIHDLVRKLGLGTILLMEGERIKKLLNALGFNHEQVINACKSKQCEYEGDNFSESLVLDCLGVTIVKCFINTIINKSDGPIKVSDGKFTMAYMVKLHLNNVRVSEQFEKYEQKIRDHAYRIRALVYEVPCSGEFNIYVIITINSTEYNLALAKALV